MVLSCFPFGASLALVFPQSSTSCVLFPGKNTPSFDCWVVLSCRSAVSNSTCVIRDNIGLGLGVVVGL